MGIEDLCPECGSPLQIEKYGCAVTYRCQKCGWSVSTTEFEEIDLDRNEYKVHLQADGSAIKETLSFLSKITGLNFFACKKLIQNGGLIFVGNARDVVSIRNELDSKKLKYTIEPVFPY